VTPATRQRIAATPFCFGGCDPWVAYRYFQRAGIRWVEVPALPPLRGIADGITCFAPEAMNDADVQLLEDRLSGMGLQPLTVAAMCHLVETREIEALERRIDFARSLGCTYVISDSCEDSDLKHHRSQVISALRRIGDYAAARGVRVALETHPGPTMNGRSARRFLEDVAHPNVGYNYDTGNILYYNDSVDPVKDIQEVAKQVVHVHLKDTQGGRGEWKFCALGEGRVNFKEVVQALKAAGFEGPYSLELEGIEGEDLRREEYLQRLIKSLDHLRSIGLVESS
jgi:L-ribulose-5-phosphate 3-epimerase